MTTNESLPHMPCPACETSGSVVRTTRPAIEVIRGVEVPVTKVVRRCEACGLEFENTRDPDWRPAAYDLYRQKVGLLAPGEIVAWREAYGLTQADVTRLLGWGEVTLGRYETGALQSEAHDKALRQLMVSSHLARVIGARPEAVPTKRRLAVIEKIRSDAALLPAGDLQVIRAKYGLDEDSMGRLVSYSGSDWRAWEAGEGLPDKSVDILLRLLARRPDIVRDLLAAAGIESADAERTLQEYDRGVSEQVSANLRERGGGHLTATPDLVREVQEEIMRVQPEVAARVLRRAA